MALTYGTIFIGFGLFWMPFALLLMKFAKDSHRERRAAVWCLVGWITSFAAFIGWGLLECSIRGVCGS